MRRLVGITALLAVSVWGLPAFAGQALTDEDLDAVTAAGEPKVIIAESESGVARAEVIDEAIFNLVLPSDAQKGLRALTVANVVGEAQLLVNLNVLSVQNSVNSTDQRNFSVQSWGSTMPLLKATVDGVPGLDQGGCKNDCEANGNIGLVAAPGQIQIGSASADVIMRADGKAGGRATLTEEPIFNLVFSPNAQVDLAALFIANVVGRAQAAYNINIAAARLNLIPTTDPGSPAAAFADPVLAATGVIKQTNSGVQFRGTPLGVGNTAATVSITHTP